MAEGPFGGVGGASTRGPGDNRNLIIAMVLAAAILLLYEVFVLQPMQKQEAARRALAAKPAAVSEQSLDKAAAAPAATREAALAATARAPIASSSLDGSINLQGARFDDLSLREYRQTVDPKSPEVTLLSPQGAKGAYDAFFGWEEDGAPSLVGATTDWTAPAGARLAPDKPLVLTYQGPNGLTFTRTISLDEHFLFTIKDVVTNTGAQPRTIRPFAAVRRTGLPADFLHSGIVLQGFTGVFGADKLLHEKNYGDADKLAKQKRERKVPESTRLFEAAGQGGWLGVSDHYWLSALMPAQDEPISGYYDSRPENGAVDYRAAYRGSDRTIAPGGRAEYVQHFFAGAKRAALLKTYEEKLGAKDFDKAVDWGNFWFFTRPIFWLLDTLGQWIGNFGLAILATTIVVKLALFPLVNKSFETTSKMRKVQPQLKEIQERFASDKPRQQQEMMALYKRENLNPIAGCLPILVQIPIFYSLYKVLTVTIEMRHAPFFGWVQDLSARDPTTIFNLFGLLPYDPSVLPLLGTSLHIGIWPILYGITMWGVQSLSPPPPDPIQARIFQVLPFLFTFMFAGMAAGLVIYWVWSNLLSIVQQYIVMRRYGVETEFDKFVQKYVLKKKPEGAT